MNAFKKILPFLASYWIMLTLAVVALVVLPTAFLFAQSLNHDHVENVQRQVSEDYDKATKSKITYSLPGLAGEKVLEKPGDLNAEMINWYAERWKATEAKTAAVWDQGLKFNRADHELLVQGLFPSPPELERDVKIRELIDEVIKFHQRLLVQAHAGMPPSAAELAEQVNDYRAAFIERAKSQRGPGEPDSAEKEKLSKELVDVRVDRCRKRAADLGVYADLSIFDGILLSVPTKAPTLAQAWDYQERCWVHADLIRAVVNANASSQTGIAGGVVKRVLRIAVRPPPFDPANPASLPFEAGIDRAPTDLSKRITGRISGPGSNNRWYDVREATIEAVISSKRLPAFIDALAATNFLTVLDIDLSPISPREHLRDGFDYGDEHVVHARLQVESVFLRDWRKDAMPDAVKQALAMLPPDGGQGGFPAKGPAGKPPAAPNASGAGGNGGGRRPE